MDPNWATHHLQVIRTLMERSAIYRRALAPVMMMLGALGLLAAVLGWFLRLGQPAGFAAYWMAVSLAGICAAYTLVRRQALHAEEPFWSSPTRRVTQALLPPLFAGMVAGCVTIFYGSDDAVQAWWLPPIWMVLYGSAVHAAGFFTPRGIRLFGWLFVGAGALLAPWVAVNASKCSLLHANLAMGAFFGGFHLAYGLYLNVTERNVDLE